jgi:copper chaperone CopZ
MATLTLKVDNMHCGSCIRKVTLAINTVPGTHAEEVRLGNARVSTTAPPEQVQQALRTAGFPSFVEATGA